MQHDVLWFACLCLENNIADKAQLRSIRDTLGPDAQVLSWGESILERGITTDVNVAQALINTAFEQVQAQNPPPYDPFEEEPRATAAEPEAPIALDPSVPLVASGNWPDFPALETADAKAVLAATVDLLLTAQQAGCSDIHLCAAARPYVRRSRFIEYISEHILSADLSLRMNTALLSPALAQVFKERMDLDYALGLDEANRFRVNLMMHKDGPKGTYRCIPNRVAALEELGFSNAATLRKLLTYHNGLILVTGPVGSGKTTTLASLVQELNVARNDHIITVEDPIEIVIRSEGCNVTQREVGPHTKSFHSALKGALRQDPDIIVVAEMRNLETIEMAISASETGHLVIGTMHTSDAATTLNRLLDVFPPAQQAQIRAMVAESLRGIICQRLLPGKNGGVVLACELLMKNLAVAALIREGKSQGLRNIIETGVREGMVLMDQSVFDLWQQGKISDDVALQNITAKPLRDKIAPPTPAPAAAAAAPATEPEKKKKLGLF